MKATEEMNYKEIKIPVKQQAPCVPVSIAFQTAFIFADCYAFKTMYDDAHKKLIAFLKENNLSYDGPAMVHMDNGEVQYYYSSYKVKLNKRTYSKLENYRNANPQLVGVIIKADFSEKDRSRLLKKIKTQALSEALKIAEKQGLTLISDLEIAQVNEIKKWTVYPPSSARINYDNQLLDSHYEFIFKAK